MLGWDLDRSVSGRGTHMTCRKNSIATLVLPSPAASPDVFGVSSQSAMQPKLLVNLTA